MVTYEHLAKLTDNSRFAPFTVALKSGKTLQVTAPFQALVTKRDFLFTPDGNTMSFHPLATIVSARVLSEEHPNRKEVG